MTDVFRKEYRALSEEEKLQLDVLKSDAQELHDNITEATTETNGREMALAKTKLEEAVMWAVKGITG